MKLLRNKKSDVLKLRIVTGVMNLENKCVLGVLELEKCFFFIKNKI